MYCLLIWDVIPETSDLYLIPSTETEAWEIIEKVNGKYMNETSMSEIEANMLTRLTAMIERDKEKEGTGSLEKYKVEVPVTILQDVRVFRCGWYA